MVVLMAPIALSGETWVSVLPFAIATCIAASASVSMPIGYRTKNYVYGGGGYRFSGFARAGLAFNRMSSVVRVQLFPQIWTF